MIDKARLRAQLSLHEGRYGKVYDDATGRPISSGTFVRGLPTIGVGRNVADRGLSDDEVDFLLDHDIADCIHDAGTLPGFQQLDPVRQALLVELVFNVGLTRLKGFKHFLAHIAAGNFVGAGFELENSAWFKQVGSRGPRLVQQCVSGQWQP